MPDTLRVGVPDVSVMPVSTPDDPLGLRTFDITFVGDSGKINQPELVVSAIKDELGNSLLASSQLDVRTIKETSPEFRVNADEPDNPFTPTVDKFDQTSAAVAMDADGDFVITWQSVVPSTPNSPASKVDIFARRFSPVGWQDPADVDFVQGVDALGGQFQVNTFTTGIQEDPSVGIDADGNFTISWDTVGQDVSFFNGVFAQRFNRDGDRIGGEFMVNTYDTNEHRPVGRRGQRRRTYSDRVDRGSTDVGLGLGAVLRLLARRPTPDQQQSDGRQQRRRRLGGVVGHEQQLRDQLDGDDSRAAWITTTSTEAT